jgi:hypothetical protein
MVGLAVPIIFRTTGHRKKFIVVFEANLLGNPVAAA